MAYLEIHKDHFHSIRTDANGRHLVTPRAWEDLSDSLKTYEKLGLPITLAMVRSYIQDEDISKSFYIYLELWNKYKEVFRIPEILEGSIPSDRLTFLKAAFDEKLSLIELLVSSLEQEFKESAYALESQRRVYEALLLVGESDVDRGIAERIGAAEEELAFKKEASMLSREEERLLLAAIGKLQKLREDLARRTDGTEEKQGDYVFVKEWFAKTEEERAAFDDAAGEHLTNAFRFLNEIYREGQEMVIFLSRLTGSYYSMKFIQEHGNEEFYFYNRTLLLQEQEKEIEKLL